MSVADQQPNLGHQHLFPQATWPSEDAWNYPFNNSLKDPNNRLKDPNNRRGRRKGKANTANTKKEKNIVPRVPSWNLGEEKIYAHINVPRTKNLLEVYAPDNDVSIAATTIMIRNIPNRYRQRELVLELNQNKMKNSYDFVYLPMDKYTTSNVGYAFVNFISAEKCQKAMEIFNGYRFLKYQTISRKIASVSIAHIQGLANNLKHYKQSAVNESKIKEHRPMVRQHFPKKKSQNFGASVVSVTLE